MILEYPIFTNKRYIDITPRLRVGFNYLKQQYYVTNTDTNNITYTTYRNYEVLPNGDIDTSAIQEVLEVFNVTNLTYPEVIEKLPELATILEELIKVSYTLQDTGAYIHTLQFNDFAEYPLTIDCEKSKLYIMNTSIIYDLTLNESPKHVRIPRILSYYREKLGLDIKEQDMKYFYSLLVSYYNPTCYNQIATNPDTGIHFYNNKFLLSNYNNTSNATYICTYNPNNNAELTQIGFVTNTDTSTGTIDFAEPIDISSLQGYNKVVLTGATTLMEDTDTTYSADGEYTIESLITPDEENPTTFIGIKVSNTIPYSYSFQYKECYALSTQKTISKMDSATRTMTLTTQPTDILVGDIILVSGATVPTPYETVSCNGSYTVSRIGTLNPDGTPNPNSIEVEEEIPTDFTGSATLIKEIFIGNISTIQGKTITLTEPTEQGLTNSTILVHTIENGMTNIESYTVSTQTTNTITVLEDIAPYNYADTCPKLYIPIPNPTVNAEVLIDITSVSENAQEIFPMGEFLVDNFHECVKYIGILSGLVTPTEGEEEGTTQGNLYKELPTTMELKEIPDLTTPTSIDKVSCSIPSMEFKGLYQEIYTE